MVPKLPNIRPFFFGFSFCVSFSVWGLYRVTFTVVYRELYVLDMSCSFYNWWWERHFFQCKPSASTIPVTGIDTSRISSLLWRTLSAKRLPACDNTAFFVTEKLPVVLCEVCAWIAQGIATPTQREWARDLLHSLGGYDSKYTSVITVGDLLEDWRFIQTHFLYDDDPKREATIPCSDDPIGFTEECIACINRAGFVVH